jgi:tetratricopeptide (TPR) repeat protein
MSLGIHEHESLKEHCRDEANQHSSFCQFHLVGFTPRTRSGRNIDAAIQGDEIHRHGILRQSGGDHTEQKKLPEAYKAFQKSAAHCASLVILQPNNALYHRDCAISHLNSGLILEQQGDVAAAREEYLESLESAGSATELNPQWLDLARDAESRVGRLKDNGP